jgi:hypothetical protein
VGMIALEAQRLAKILSRRLILFDSYNSVRIYVNNHKCDIRLRESPAFFDYLVLHYFLSPLRSLQISYNFLPAEVVKLLNCLQ